MEEEKVPTLKSFKDYEIKLKEYIKVINELNFLNNQLKKESI